MPGDAGAHQSDSHEYPEGLEESHKPWHNEFDQDHHHYDECVVNNVTEVSLYSRSLTITSVYITVTPNKFQDILSEAKWEAPVKPVLIMTGGLPHSGQSEAIRLLLHLSSAESVKKVGFTHHDVISVGDRLVTTKDRYIIHHFGFLAGIRTNFSDEMLQVDHFTDDNLSASLADECIPHYLSLRKSWENLKEKSHIESLFHSRSLKKRTALVKIWDIAFDSFSLQFLRCFSGHFYNSYMWLFTDVERDQRNLHLPPSKDETQLMARRSRIQYLLNPCRISSKLKCERENVCTVFAKHTGVLDESLKDRIIALQREYKAAGPQLGCSKLIREKAIPISFDGVSSQQVLIEQLQKAVPKASQMIPLSHLFLRGSLELESSVFMRREELKRKARLCGIDDDESFDEFCKSFTSFGSIIDVGLVSTSDIIIVKPDEFLTTLDQAFNFERIKDYQVAHDGLLTSYVALCLLGYEYKLFLEILGAVGLATPVAGGQCQPPQDTSQCYYMPSLRQHDEVKEFNPKAVQMVRSQRYPSINMEVALTKHLLLSLPNPQLVLTGKKNVTIIASSAGDVTITYHGEAIEFLVSPDHQDVIRQVIEACKKISLSLDDRSGEARFHFAVLCKKHTDYLAAYSYYRKCHILDNVTEDCKHCQGNISITTWISKSKIDESLKLDGSLTIQDISRLIDEISTYDAYNVQLFIKALNSSKELPEDRSKWKWILMEVLALWMKQPHKESTKKKMAVILIGLHERYKKESFSFGKVRFKKLARELDLQTLTFEQMQELYLQEQKQNESDDNDEIRSTNECDMKKDNENELNSVNLIDDIRLTLDDVSKLMVILQPLVEDDWYKLGHHLDIDTSTLCNINQDSTIQMLLLQKFCTTQNCSVTKLVEALTVMNRIDLIPGLLELKSKTKNVGVQVDYCNHLIDNLSGIHIAGKETFVIQGDSAQSINWEEYGLRIDVMEGSLPASETAEIAVIALAGGKFEFPEGTQLVSAVYAISVSKPLIKPLRLDMQHCVELVSQSQTKYMTFAIAPIDTPSLPYKFKIVKGGEFTVDNFYGSICRFKFCLVCELTLPIETEQQHQEQNGSTGSSNGDGTSSNDHTNDDPGEDDDDDDDDSGGDQDLITVPEAEAVTSGDNVVENNSKVDVPDNENETTCSSCETNETESNVSFSESIIYAGILFDRRDLVTFSVLQNLDALKQYVKKNHPQAGVHEPIKFNFQRDFDSIELIFDDKKQKSCTTGWVVDPQTEPCQLLRKHIDDCASIPTSVEILVYTTGSPDTVKVLNYAVQLKGIEPQKSMKIYRSLETTNTKAIEQTINDVDGSVFSPPDIIMSKAPKFTDLINVLANISDVWKLIGLALGFQLPELNSIQNNEASDKLRLSQMLQNWIEKNKDVTWKTIVKAVQGPIVDKESQVDIINNFLSSPNAN